MKYDSDSGSCCSFPLADAEFHLQEDKDNVINLECSASHESVDAMQPCDSDKEGSIEQDQEPNPEELMKLWGLPTSFVGNITTNMEKSTKVKDLLTSE